MNSFRQSRLPPGNVARRRCDSWDFGAELLRSPFLAGGTMIFVFTAIQMAGSMVKLARLVR
jgi:hypothetical protein